MSGNIYCACSKSSLGIGVDYTNVAIGEYFIEQVFVYMDQLRFENQGIHKMPPEIKAHEELAALEQVFASIDLLKAENRMLHQHVWILCTCLLFTVGLALWGIWSTCRL